MGRASPSPELPDATVGMLAFFLMADSPDTARWLSPSDRLLARARLQAGTVIARGPPSRHLSQRQFREGALNVNSILCGAIFLCAQVVVQGVRRRSVAQLTQQIAVFLPTILTGLYPNTSVPYRQVRTIPPYAWGAVWTIAMAIVSAKTRYIAPYVIGSTLLSIAGLCVRRPRGSADASVPCTSAVRSASSRSTRRADGAATPYGTPRHSSSSLGPSRSAFGPTAGLPRTF